MTDYLSKWRDAHKKQMYSNGLQMKDIIDRERPHTKEPPKTIKDPLRVYL